MLTHNVHMQHLINWSTTLRLGRFVLYKFLKISNIEIHYPMFLNKYYDDRTNYVFDNTLYTQELLENRTLPINISFTLHIRIRALIIYRTHNLNMFTFLYNLPSRCQILESDIFGHCWTWRIYFSKPCSCLERLRLFPLGFDDPVSGVQLYNGKQVLTNVTRCKQICAQRHEGHAGLTSGHGTTVVRVMPPIVEFCR